jgi:chromosome segregation ATPase
MDIDISQVFGLLSGLLGATTLCLWTKYNSLKSMLSDLSTALDTAETKIDDIKNLIVQADEFIEEISTALEDDTLSQGELTGIVSQLKDVVTSIEFTVGIETSTGNDTENILSQLTELAEKVSSLSSTVETLTATQSTET